MKIKNLFNRKWFKSLRSFLRNKATLAEAELWDILKSKQLDGDPRYIKSQSTTPAANKFCNILTIIVLRPPLLQKEGRILLHDLISTLNSVYLYGPSQ